MDFLEEVDSLKIVENHITSLLKLEEAKAQALIRKYEDTRLKLRLRLQNTRPSTFTAQQLRGTLLQIETALAQMSKGLRTDMISGAEAVTAAGIEDMVEEMRVFQKHFGSETVPINVDAVAAAMETSNYLVREYEDSMTDYSDALMNNLQNALTQALIEQKPYPDVVKSISEFFLAEQWKIHRIARTELHNLYNKGKLTGMARLTQTHFPDLMKTLIHPMDGRTAADSKYLRELNLRIPIDRYFEYYWPPKPSFKAKLRRFLAPPDRPNDRAILVPYRAEWDDKPPTLLDNLSEAADLLNFLTGG